MTVKRSIFRSLATAAALLACAAITACAAFTAAPGAAQVAAIQSACIVDATVRPTLDVLLVLATPAENDAVKLARAAIDPVCANPTAPLAADAATTFAESTAQIANVLGSLQARKKTAAPAPAASSAG